MPIDKSHHLGQILLSFQSPGHRPFTVVLSLPGLTRMHGVDNYKVEVIGLTRGGGWGGAKEVLGELLVWLWRAGSLPGR